MGIGNRDIARKLERLADLLEIEGENPFRVRAYRNAAQTIADLLQPVAELVRTGSDLAELPNVGAGIATTLRTIIETGELPQLRRIEKRVPGVLSDLMHIRGLGPKRMKRLYRELGISSVEDLERAARSGRIRRLEGFGARMEEMILAGVQQYRSAADRTLLSDAEQIAEPLVEHLRRVPGVKDVTVAGSFRRRRETVGDLDILATASRGSPVVQQFTDYDQVAEVISQGTTRASVQLNSGLQVDLRVVPQVSYGAALQYFTGSKAHNVALRRLAQAKRLKVNEYGVFSAKKRVAGKTERQVYACLGLDLIQPELRENQGEIEAARRDRLPGLVSMSKIRGDLHCHTKATDGHDSPEAMARAAAQMGYEYLAIADHTQHVTVAHGLNARQLARQIRQIDRLNEKLDGIVVLKAAEVDILADGSLDLPDSILHQLDLTVCAVHYGFSVSRTKQTERIIRAMDNPHFNILAHPTGRLINERLPYEIDLERVMRAALDRRCFLEVNAQPTRLDLNDQACRLAKELGLKLAISTDAHSALGLGLMRFGIDQARRGWLEATDVINTRPLSQLRRMLRRHSG